MCSPGYLHKPYILHTYIHMYVCTFTYIASMHIEGLHVYECIRTYVHTYICAHHIYVHMYVLVCMYKCIIKYVCTYVCVYCTWYERILMYVQYVHTYVKHTFHCLRCRRCSLICMLSTFCRLVFRACAYAHMFACVHKDSCVL